MKLALAAAIVGAVLVASAPFLVQSSGPAPARYDVDGDGVISILDVAAVGSHMYEHSGPCAQATVQHYVTPVTAYANGTPYLVSGRAWPTDHLAEILSGTPIPWCP